MGRALRPGGVWEALAAGPPMRSSSLQGTTGLVSGRENGLIARFHIFPAGFQLPRVSFLRGWQGLGLPFPYRRRSLRLRWPACRKPLSIRILVTRIEIILHFSDLFIG